MDERRTTVTRRRYEHSVEATSIADELLFESVVKSLEKLPNQKRQQLLERWDRAAFYSQGFASRGTIEYRPNIRPSPKSVTATTRMETNSELPLFYRSGIFASAVLTITVLATTLTNIIVSDLGIPVTLGLFGIFLAFSIERVRFGRRIRRIKKVA